jgi:putative NADH-flavin reductase
MSEIVIFGAGGRAGRHAVAEAVARGHRVTAVVRDPAAYQDLAGDGVALVGGDATDADSVAAVAAGHDAAISAVARLDTPSEEFFVGTANALLDGLARAGVGRLVLIGIGTTLQVEPGVMLLDTPGFPADARTFSLGHAAALEALRAARTGVDWVVLAPPPTFLDAEAARTGRYRVGGDQVVPAEDDVLFPYADLAAALVDEIEAPKHHRALVAVAR